MLSYSYLVHVDACVKAEDGVRACAPRAAEAIPGPEDDCAVQER
jgi:hypothetical protein